VPVFAYKALDAAGEVKQGIIDATTAREAREKLRGRKLFVTDIQPAKGGARKSKSKAKALEPDEGAFDAFNTEGAAFSLQRLFLGRARAELTGTTRLLATLLKAGIPLIDALSSVIQQVEDPYLSTTLRQIREDVRGGISLADAVAAHPELFDPLFANMVRAG